MARGAAWPEERVDVLRRCVYEKSMPVKDMVKVFKCSEASIRSQLKRHSIPCPAAAFYPKPDMDYFDSYGVRPELKVV